MRQTHPDLTIILYISGSGGLLERMAAAKPDVISIDQRVAMEDAIRRIGPEFAVQARTADSTLSLLSLGCLLVKVLGWCPQSCSVERSGKDTGAQHVMFNVWPWRTP